MRGKPAATDQPADYIQPPPGACIVPLLAIRASAVNSNYFFSFLIITTFLSPQIGYLTMSTIEDHFGNNPAWSILEA